MRITIDKETNTVCIRDTKVVDIERSEDLGKVVIDYDIKDNIIGLEFLNGIEAFGDLDKLTEQIELK